MNNNLNKMLLVNSNTVETYEYNVKYMVDIITNEEDGVYEAWFYFPDHGMKNEMDRFQIDKYSKEDVIQFIEYYIKKDAQAYEQDIDALEEAFWKRIHDEKEKYRRLYGVEEVSDDDDEDADDIDIMCRGVDDGDDCETCELYYKAFEQS